MVRKGSIKDQLPHVEPKLIGEALGFLQNIPDEDDNGNPEPLAFIQAGGGGFVTTEKGRRYLREVAKLGFNVRGKYLPTPTADEASK